MLGKSFWLVFDAIIHVVELLFNRQPKGWDLRKKNNGSGKPPDDRESTKPRDSN